MPHVIVRLHDMCHNVRYSSHITDYSLPPPSPSLSPLVLADYHDPVISKILQSPVKKRLDVKHCLNRPARNGRLLGDPLAEFEKEMSDWNAVCEKVPHLDQFPGRLAVAICRKLNPDEPDLEQHAMQHLVPDDLVQKFVTEKNVVTVKMFQCLKFKILGNSGALRVRTHQTFHGKKTSHRRHYSFTTW